MELLEGSNMITIVASNPSGKQTKIDRIINYQILSPIIEVTVPEKTNMTSIKLDGRIYDNVDPSPIVTINGETIKTSYEGKFTKEISLIEGPNIITIMATSNLTGKVSKVERIIVSEILAPVLNINVPDTSSADKIQISGNVSDIIDRNPTVKVNGLEVTVSSSGMWNSLVELVEGENNITIVAINNLGKETIIERIVIYIP